MQPLPAVNKYYTLAFKKYILVLICVSISCKCFLLLTFTIQTVAANSLHCVYRMI